MVEPLLKDTPNNTISINYVGMFAIHNIIWSGYHELPITYFKKLVQKQK